MIKIFNKVRTSPTIHREKYYQQYYQRLRRPEGQLPKGSNELSLIYSQGKNENRNKKDVVDFKVQKLELKLGP